MFYEISLAAASYAGTESAAFGNFAYIFLGIAVAVGLICVVLLFKISKQEEKLRDIEKAGKDVEEELSRVRAENHSLIQTIQSSFHTFGEMVSANQLMSAENQDKRLADLNARFSNMAVENEQKLENIRATVEKRLGELTADNSRQLEQMRQTVDEKLHKTLETRIGQSFMLVNARLEQVYKGLGEMRSLAAGVGDLKKVLSNVKTRGILGEVQLGAILEQILAPEQYAENVRTRPSGTERVEFAVRLPGAGSGAAGPVGAGFGAAGSGGRLTGAGASGNGTAAARNAASGGGTLSSFDGVGADLGGIASFAPFDGITDSALDQVWLPIDAKFPGDTYSALVDAYESGEAGRVEAAAKALERAIRAEAKDVREKYVEPPFTTDFAIMFLPFEGLYAEVVRRGMVESLQRDYKVNIAGPTTMAALLNSLQMGFKTLAIQKHSGEVWNVLGAVKTEFDKFGAVLESTQSKINQANAELDKLVGVRTRSIQRKLRGVASLGSGESARILGTEGAKTATAALGSGEGFGESFRESFRESFGENAADAAKGGFESDIFGKSGGGGEL